jgi:AAA+ superfamily predicted ATPase
MAEPRDRAISLHETSLRETSLWESLNHQALMAAIADVESYFQADASPNAAAVPVSAALEPPAAIDQLCYALKLTPFERAIVLLCAGVELSRSLPPLLAAHHHDPQGTSLTFGLALGRLPQGHWSAITPESPLRRWQVIDLGGSPVLMQSPLRINERILHFLLGNTQLDAHLLGLATVLPPAPPLALPDSQQRLVDEIVALLQQPSPPLIQLCGYDSATKRMIAMAVAAARGSGLLNLAAHALPTESAQLHRVHTLWEREAMLTQSLLLLDSDSVVDSAEGGVAPPQVSAIAQLMESCRQPLLVLSRDRRSVQQRPLISFETTQPTATEQRQVWLQLLESQLGIEPGDMATAHPHINAFVGTLVSHFSLSPLAIQTLCTQSLASCPDPTSPELAPRLWTACLSYARPRLEELAQPIRTQVGWDDLVLPDKEKQILRAIAAQVRQRVKVYEQWGFANKGQRGLGISVLFAGASGTGKTLAAEVLANELHLDLYRIDLSSVVSKYIGETEKNLRRIFDAAEQGGAILLFDEADALFGKRSEVKDSHDRYANMEVAYLLQRMEAYRGLAILTSNLKNSLDQAFLRRLRFVVQFAFPDAGQRSEIWRRVFPPHTPTLDLVPHKLARLNVPGGNIRNIALNAAFLAADAEVPVQMCHILQAAQSEYSKLERPLTESEIKGWE